MSQRAPISDYLYITEETKNYWDSLTPEKKHKCIEDAEFFLEEYNNGDPMNVSDVVITQVSGL